MLKEVPYAVYSEQDVRTIQGQIRRGLSVAGGFAAVAFAAMVVTLVYRIQWLTIAITLVWGALTIFLWSMKLSPPLAYKRHLKEIHQGLCRTTLGKLVKVETDLTFRDGVDFYAVLVNIGDQGDPEDDRLFYWDAQKPWPGPAEGGRVEIVSHGNDIIGLRGLDV